MRKKIILSVVVFATILGAALVHPQSTHAEERTYINSFVASPWGDAYLDVYEVHSGVVCKPGNQAYMVVLIPAWVEVQPSRLPDILLGEDPLQRIYQIRYDVTVCAQSSELALHLVNGWWVELRLSVPSMRFEDYGPFYEDGPIHQLLWAFLDYERKTQYKTVELHHLFWEVKYQDVFLH